MTYSVSPTPPPQRPFTKVHAIRWALYTTLIICLLISLIAIPWWVDVGRDLYAAWCGDSTPTATPWIYSSVAVGECLHLILMFFGLSAAYDESFAKSVIYAACCATIGVGLFTICCYIHVIITIVVQIALAFGYAYYAYVINSESKIYGGRSTPLI